jgi:NAD(P)-dependent dehydrogenase (short-subunit alcohol dehydrogenase family)
MPVAIITGGTKGIGLSTAKLLHQKGFDLCICSSDEENVKAAKSEFEDSVLVLKCDVANYKDVQRVFSETSKRFGSLDVLINAAAIITNQLFDSMTIEDFDNVMNVNFRSCIYTIKQAFKYMNNGGSIINISSLGGVSGYEKFPGFSAYSISKFAVTGLTEILSVEAKEKNIRINAIAPGAVNTDMLAKAAPGLKSKTEPHDVATIIEFLSDESKSGHISGAVIPLNTNL